MKNNSKNICRILIKNQWTSNKDDQFDEIIYFIKLYLSSNKHYFCQQFLSMDLK